MGNDSYSNHQEQREGALPPPGRAQELEEALGNAFHDSMVRRETPYIDFNKVSIEALARAFVNYPILVKTVLASVNLGVIVKSGV